MKTKKKMLAIKTPQYYLEERKNLIVIKNADDDKVMFIWGKISKTFLFINENFSRLENYFRFEFTGSYI